MSLSFDAQTLIAVLTVGLSTGVVTGLLTQSRGVEFAANVAIGIAGAFIGYTVLGLAGLSEGGLLASTINATFGSILLLTILQVLERTRIGSIAVLDDIQEIRRLTVTPEPGAMVISFETRLPSRPTFEIFRFKTGVQSKDVVPQNIVTVWGSESPARRTHRRRIDGLPHGTVFWIRVTADVEGVVSVSGRPFQSDTVVRASGTLYRKCLLSILLIVVGWTGDPEGDVTMDFVLQVYNGAHEQNPLVNGVPRPGDPLISQRDWEFKGVDNGRTLEQFSSPPGGRTVPIEDAPDIIVPYILGVNQFGLFGTATPPTLPDQPSHGSTDVGLWADAFAASPPLSTTMGTTSATMSLGTGLVEIEWRATISLETIVSDPRGVLGL